MPNNSTVILLLQVIATLMSWSSLSASEDYLFENLGRPLTPQAIPVEAVTHSSTGETIAWCPVSDPDRFGILGINVKTGADILIDLSKYRRSSSIQLVKGKSGHLYIYAGKPAHFFKYDPETHKLVDLGVPARPGHYITGHAFTDDGVFYVGSYPKTHFVGIDTATDKIISVGKIAEEDRQRYIIGPVAAADGTIYIPVGLHHAELWAYSPTTKKKWEIPLPKSLAAQQGVVTLIRAADGGVYGRKGNVFFKCSPDKTELIDALPAAADMAKARRSFEGREYLKLDSDGCLVSRESGSKELSRLKTSARARTVLIYSISTLYNGKIIGGGFIPSRTWSYDPATNKMEDWGKFVKPNTQVYDTLNHRGKLFLSSYSFAHLDRLDPETRKVQHIGNLNEKYGMERIQHLIEGPDQMIYGPTRPSKGYLDGGIVRINPEDLSIRVVSPILKGLAPTGLVLLEESGLFFGTTTIRGGTSAIPTEEAAKCFIWDPKTEKVVWEGVPVPDVTEYRGVVRGRDGLVYGISQYHYFVFDPVKREVLHTGDLPVKPRRGTRLVRGSVGPDGTVYALTEGAVIGISPEDYQARVVATHPSIMKRFHEDLHGNFAAWLSPDGVLYYGSGSELWRVNLAKK